MVVFSCRICELIAMPKSLYEELGGEDKLRAIIDDFVDRVFEDTMIGFFFRSVSKKRVQTFEFQLAAEFLGAPIQYGGRSLRDAHRKHKIMGGQFARRTQILKETMAAHKVSPKIQKIWLDHTESLRGEITGDRDHECR